MPTSPSRRPGSRPSGTTRCQIRPTLSRSTRNSAGDRGLVGLGRQECHQVLEVTAEPRTVPGERHRLDPHPMARTDQPAQRRPHDDLPAPQVQSPPAGEPRPDVIASPGAERTLRALQWEATPGWTSTIAHDGPA